MHILIRAIVLLCINLATAFYLFVALFILFILFVIANGVIITVVDTIKGV